MAKYYQTDNGGYLETDDSQEAQPGWTPITKDEYDALLAAAQAAQDQANADALAAANQRWTTVHDDLVTAGVSEAAATILANAVGIPPAEG